MSDRASFAELTRGLVHDPAYRETLTCELAARRVDDDIVRQLIAYARSRQTTIGQAMARQVLTAAGVSWESL